nr:uncharacterized protein LOC127340271 [Lolium perenne]
MESILSFFLCGQGVRLSVECVSNGVFHVVVASPAVARFLLRSGPKHCERFQLGFHASLPAARDAAAAVTLAPTPPPPRKRRARRRKPAWSRLPASSVGFGGKSLIPLPRAGNLESLRASTAVAQPVPSPFKEAASAAAPLPPYTGEPMHPPLEPNATSYGAPPSPAANRVGCFNAPAATPAPRSYLDVASSPPSPCPKTPAAPFKLLSLDGCFRCLSPLHLVRECRDPIRCRACGRSGHRRRECTMPFPQPTFVPTVRTPRPAAAVTAPPRRVTPYPSALSSPLSPSPSARRARSLSPPRRMGPLFEVGESSHPPIPEEERLIHVVEPPQPTRAEPVGSLVDDEEEVESGDDSDEPPDEVFMPPDDMFTARCMAVAYVELLPPFTSPGAAIAEAIFTELPGLHVTLVPSSLGDMYAKFLSEEESWPFSTSLSTLTGLPFALCARRKPTASPVTCSGSLSSWFGECRRST